MERVPCLDIAWTINVQFRTDYSKNAIIGRAKRLKLPPHHGAQPKVSKQPPKPKRFKPMARVVRKQELPEFEVSVPSREGAWEMKPDAIGILELHDHQTCKWPYSGTWNAPVSGYCGRQVEGQGPYCETHRSIAYKPTPERERLQERHGSQE